MNAPQMLNTPDQKSSPRGFNQIIRHIPTLGRVLEQVEYLSPTDSTVLIEL
jgi:transcriptional regulator with GAF, ATPase, and Fis domain